MRDIREIHRYLENNRPLNHPQVGELTTRGTSKYFELNKNQNMYQNVCGFIQDGQAFVLPPSPHAAASEEQERPRRAAYLPNRPAGRGRDWLRMLRCPQTGPRG